MLPSHGRSRWFKPNRAYTRTGLSVPLTWWFPFFYTCTMDSYIAERTQGFSQECSSLDFTFDGYIYNPLEYAHANHFMYLDMYVKKGARVFFLGMNPGPFGMLQTGVPFGEVNIVRDYLGIDNPVDAPLYQHPGRPVLGMNITRSEISGLRFWNMIKNKYPNPELLSSECCVMNFCPLGFISSVPTARNITPDKLVKSERLTLERVCMKYLDDMIRYIKPTFLVGIGKYAKERLLVPDLGIPVFSIIHPSPGNPLANNNWADRTLEYLKENGIWS